MMIAEEILPVKEFISALGTGSGLNGLYMKKKISSAAVSAETGMKKDFEKSRR